MTTEKVAVAPEFLQKVVGFAEATNAVLKEAEESKAELRKVATDAVDALEKAGKLNGQNKEDLVDGFVRQPGMALKLAASMANEMDKEAKGEHYDKSKKNKKKDMDKKDEYMSDKEASIGRADEPEKKPVTGASGRESDEVWERGFGFSL